jgi:hypothetical protein
MTRRYWADVPSIGARLLPPARFWQVLTRARWGPTTDDPGQSPFFAVFWRDCFWP